MSSKFKILSKKNLHDGFFKMNEVILKYKKHDGSWSNKVKRELFGGAQVSCLLPYDPIKTEDKLPSGRVIFAPILSEYLVPK